MNRCVAVVAVSLYAAAGASAGGPPDGLVVTEVMVQTTAGTPGAINGDWWELTNYGAAPINLLGYQWADTEDALPGSESNFFPSVTINPGESLIICEELTSSEGQWRTNWGIGLGVNILSADEMVDDATPDGDTFSGLGNGGDAVFFYSPAGDLLSSYSYAAATRGVTFEAGPFADLALSIVGENGAVTAANGDIGSPGRAVPTPGAAALLVLGAIGAGRRRR